MLSCKMNLKFVFPRKELQIKVLKKLPIFYLKILNKIEETSIFFVLLQNIIIVDEDLIKNKDFLECYKEKRIYFYQLIACIFESNMSIIPKSVCLDCFFFINNNPIILENLKINPSFLRENEKEIKSSIFLLKLYDYATKNNDKFVFEKEQRFIKLLELSPL